jgi:hypothetical protein
LEFTLCAGPEGLEQARAHTPSVNSNRHLASTELLSKSNGRIGSDHFSLIAYWFARAKILPNSGTATDSM